MLLLPLLFDPLLFDPLLFDPLLLLPLLFDPLVLLPLPLSPPPPPHPASRTARATPVPATQSRRITLLCSREIVICVPFMQAYVPPAVFLSLL